MAYYTDVPAYIVHLTCEGALNQVRNATVRNQKVFVETCIQYLILDASLYEMTSRMGFDGIWLDMEHHGHSLETAAQMMRAARVGVADIVARPAKREFQRMQRMLEVGAQAPDFSVQDHNGETTSLQDFAGKKK